ncbi:IclR family transcriptional regulator C-terminal domain-containing protein [Paracoccaceae bacterium Fryx2]|nr:IclR family transcriptional regulator C-terminal domain-containing protein [Paracoccaceae bacterium Fryx2]
MDDDAAGGFRDGDVLQTLTRGLSVIACFDRNHPRMTPTEVARHANLTRAAARRILITLVATGYARTDGKVFELTARVLELGYAYLSSFGLPEVARTYMEDVTRDLGESCSLAVLDRGEIVYVARVAAQRIMEQVLEVGGRLPAHATALGQVLMAALPDDELAVILEAAPLFALTDNTITSRSDFIARLEQVRRQGYALVDEELELGVRSIAVPVRDRRNRVIAAMNVDAHVRRMSVDEMCDRALSALRRAVNETERPIGHL